LFCNLYFCVQKIILNTSTSPPTTLPHRWVVQYHPRPTNSPRLVHSIGMWWGQASLRWANVHLYLFWLFLCWIQQLTSSHLGHSPLQIRLVQNHSQLIGWRCKSGGRVSSRQVNACSLFCLHKTYLTATFLFRRIAVILLIVNVGIGGDHVHIMGVAGNECCSADWTIIVPDTNN
jgi:hypothetical protein